MLNAEGLLARLNAGGYSVRGKCLLDFSLNRRALFFLHFFQMCILGEVLKV